MKITEINATAKAKNKIKNIAKNHNLNYDLVYFIFCFQWNYDGVEGRWVDEVDEDEEYKNRYKFIYESLKLTEENLDKKQVVDQIYNQLKKIDHAVLNKNFRFGATHSNYCLVSEYASFYYLSNATKANLDTLEWRSEELKKEDIVMQLFLKIFRGGSVDRYSLEYLYADLVINLPYENQIIKGDDWIDHFVKSVSENREKTTLTGLINIIKGFCKGNKYFLKTVLEALSYSNKLKVENHAVNDIFLPDFRNKLSPHFNSNEWTYPLRFWNLSNK
ncbi:hypothetical protein [Flavobacterium limi]|uniref:Immunity protein 49 n=1 Tax=Flavobacterium limi TaxID=2045105 RepID=A0ABQ1UA26_9FLAO|nr:hypothetical protein [Flavobacterium limi]GGF14194.1 hypothetical protein GCM10011518_24320 [Flavobacterium limi]